MAGTLSTIIAITDHARAQLDRRPVQRIVGLPLQSFSEAARRGRALIEGAPLRRS